jgi:hypothetical protein
VNLERPPITASQLRLIYYRFNRSVQLLAEATVLPLITHLFVRYILVASTYLPSVERYFASPALFQTCTPWRTLCNTSVLQEHSVGTSDQGLSLDTDVGMTGQLSSTDRLQELAVQCHGVKTRVASSHSDACSATCGHSAACRMFWVRLQHHATVETFNGVKMCDSKFPPNVSKLCQHQHSAVPNKHTRNVKCQQSQLS